METKLQIKKNLEQMSLLLTVTHSACYVVHVHNPVAIIDCTATNGQCSCCVRLIRMTKIMCGLNDPTPLLSVLYVEMLSTLVQNKNIY